MTVPETVILSSAAILIGFGAAWGALRQQVTGNKKYIEDLGEKMRQRDAKIFERIDDCCKAIGKVSERVSNIEGWRNGKCQQREL